MLESRRDKIQRALGATLRNNNPQLWFSEFRQHPQPNMSDRWIQSCYYQFPIYAEHRNAYHVHTNYLSNPYDSDGCYDESAEIDYGDDESESGFQAYNFNTSTFFNRHIEDYNGTVCNCGMDFERQWILEEWICALAYLLWHGPDVPSPAAVCSQIDEFRGTDRTLKGWASNHCLLSDWE